ncbi:MAG TPA: hypothetical protein VKY19_08700 [Ktedonosporobacter sp.]|nr:hypothetical protein [Ktedonosporobacter sp.]
MQAGQPQGIAPSHSSCRIPRPPRSASSRPCDRPAVSIIVPIPQDCPAAVPAMMDE